MEGSGDLVSLRARSLGGARSLLSAGYRNQLDRAALSVSNNIAEGFERTTTGALLSFLDIARGSAGEVKSMVAVISTRQRVLPAFTELQAIRKSVESCLKQLTGWIKSIECGQIQGKRHQKGELKVRKQGTALTTPKPGEKPRAAS